MTIRDYKSTHSERLPRRLLEVGGFAALIFVFWTLDTLTKQQMRQVSGVGLDDYRLIIEQVTSGLTVLLLVPAVAWWLNYFPVSPGQLVSKIAGHLLGSLLFATAHYFLSVTMRAAIHAWNGTSYIFSDLWLQNLLVEYQKDIKIYVAIVAIISAYRYFRSRRSGANPTVDFGERMVVQTAKGDRIVRPDDIEYLEAARNYVSVHTADKEFVVRQTLASLEDELRPTGFSRTHRSFVVNLREVVELRTTDKGGLELELHSGTRVPLSRRYRDKIKSLLGL